MTISANRARLLLIDDEPQIRSLLRDYLEQFEFECLPCESAREARAVFAKATVDLVILDIMMPEEDGLSLCKWLRSLSSVPILLLTARAEAADRIVGLETGADDYLVKPFEPRELLARIRNILRRTKVVGSRVVDDMTGSPIRFAGWTLNRDTRELQSATGTLVPLSNAEYRLLWAFIERPKRLLTRDQLLDAARGRTAEPFDRSIDLLVSRLRQKLNEDPKEPKLIRTVRGEGYIFECKVAA